MSQNKEVLDRRTPGRPEVVAFGSCAGPLTSASKKFAEAWKMARYNGSIPSNPWVSASLELLNSAIFALYSACWLTWQRFISHSLTPSTLILFIKLSYGFSSPDVFVGCGGLGVPLSKLDFDLTDLTTRTGTFEKGQIQDYVVKGTRSCHWK